MTQSRHTSPHPHTSPQRQLFLTPEAKAVLESEYCAAVKVLADDIARALDGRFENDGSVWLTGTDCLLLVTDPRHEGGPERVVVWQGPTDGLFFNDEIMERAFCAGTNLL